MYYLSLLLLQDIRAGYATMYYLASRQRQRGKGPEKNLKIFMPQCLDEVATINIHSKMAITNNFVA